MILAFFVARAITRTADRLARFDPKIPKRPVRPVEPIPLPEDPRVAAAHENARKALETARAAIEQQGEKP